MKQKTSVKILLMTLVGILTVVLTLLFMTPFLNKRMTVRIQTAEMTQQQEEPAQVKPKQQKLWRRSCLVMRAAASVLI